MINCVVIQWNDVNDKDYSDDSKYQVINWNYEVGALPVAGLSDELEVLVKRTPYEIPEYDSRLVLLEVNNAASAEFDSEHTNNRMFLTTYSLVDRSTVEKEVSVEEAELENNNKVFPTNKQLKYLLLYTALSRREALGYTISDEQQAILDKGDELAAKVWFNHIEAIAKKADLEAGTEIDLDANWEKEE